MKIYNDTNSAIYWRVFDPLDAVCWAERYKGIAPSGGSASVDHPDGKLKFDLKQGSYGGLSITDAGPVYQNRTTILITPEGWYHDAPGLQLDDNPHIFSGGQADAVLLAFDRVFGTLDSCPVLDDSQKDRLRSKRASGILVSQDAIFAARGSWAESRIGGVTVTLDSVQTWSATRRPLLAAVLAHEFIHLIGEDHNDPNVPYVDTVFHKFELFYS